MKPTPPAESPAIAEQGKHQNDRNVSADVPQRASRTSRSNEPPAPADPVTQQNDRNTSADAPGRAPKTNRIADRPIFSDPAIDVAGPGD